MSSLLKTSSFLATIHHICANGSAQHMTDSLSNACILQFYSWPESDILYLVADYPQKLIIACLENQDVSVSLCLHISCLHKRNSCLMAH